MLLPPCLRFAACALLVFTALTPGTIHADSPVTDASTAILARIKVPQFAARDFVITDFGAKAGEDCSGAISAAIAACHGSGGGRVVVPEGVWLTGTVHLQSNVNPDDGAIDTASQSLVDTVADRLSKAVSERL